MAIVTADLTKYDLKTAEGLSGAIAYLLDLKKGKNIVTIDLSGKTVIADYFVIASAYSTTAVKALSNYVEDELSKCGVEPIHRDVDQKWVATTATSSCMCFTRNSATFTASKDCGRTARTNSSPRTTTKRIFRYRGTRDKPRAQINRFAK